MKHILLIVTQDYDGAAEAMIKLAKMLSTEHRVALLVKNKTRSEKFIYEYNYSRYQIYRRKIKDKLLFWDKNKSLIDPEYSFFSLDEKKKNIDVKKIIKIIGFVPDFIFNGWSAGFINSTDLLNLHLHTKAKVYNITLDMTHFTGGCHYAWDCKKYISGCDESCPALKLNKDKKLALKNFNVKRNNAIKGDFKILAASGWTLKQAKESKIYKNQKIIHNVNSFIDTKIMNNNCRSIAKAIFGLDRDCFYILAGSKDSTQSRKGFDYLVKALNLLFHQLDANDSRKIKLILVTDKKDDLKYDLIHFEKEYIDFVKDYRLLALLYQAADLFVNTSIEDSGPMMVSEALACGTPVVGFDMGIINNLVTNDYNGYKAILKDSIDLCNGIKIIFELTDDAYLKYSNNATLSVQKNSSFEYARTIFHEILYNE